MNGLKLVLMFGILRISLTTWLGCLLIYSLRGIRALGVNENCDEAFWVDLTHTHTHMHMCMHSWEASFLPSARATRNVYDHLSHLHPGSYFISEKTTGAARSVDVCVFTYIHTHIMHACNSGQVLKLERFKLVYNTVPWWFCLKNYIRSRHVSGILNQWHLKSMSRRFNRLQKWKTHHWNRWKSIYFVLIWPIEKAI